MDSYNLFGDDGSGMLEGLTDLGGTENFSNNTPSNVTGETKETDNSYRQPYNQGVSQEPPSIQKLASFGSGGSGVAGVSAPGGGPPAPEYHDYGAYPPRARMPQPPHTTLHPPHHVHPSHTYPAYHSDAMYGIPEQTGIGDMWSGAPGASRYSSVAPNYRHPYDHQQKIHQFPPHQGTALGPLQTQNGSYMPRHFAQSPSPQIYGQHQNYPNYSQMHPPASARINQHPSYHQQIDVNTHQYGLPQPHNQQSHASLSQHQHQNMAGHPGNIGPGIQGHPNVLLHHAGPPSLHHVGPRQPSVPPSSVAPTHPTPAQIPYGSPHHSLSMSYQPHQVHHPLDVNVSNQYGSVKPSGLEGNQQYRPPFPQLSPQISPRPQMSPRPQHLGQLSPRPVISPVKGPNASPHTSKNVTLSPVSSGQPQGAPNSYSSQNTLQALEQMVLPSTTEYSYQRNPSSSAVGHGTTPSPWNQNKMQPPTTIANKIENNEELTIDSGASNIMLKSDNTPSIAENNVGHKSFERLSVENDKSNQAESTVLSSASTVTNNARNDIESSNTLVKSDLSGISSINQLNNSPKAFETFENLQDEMTKQNNEEIKRSSTEEQTILEKSKTARVYDQKGDTNVNPIETTTQNEHFVNPTKSPSIGTTSAQSREHSEVNENRLVHIGQQPGGNSYSPSTSQYENLTSMGVQSEQNYKARPLQNINVSNAVHQTASPNLMPPVCSQNNIPVNAPTSFKSESSATTTNLPRNNSPILRPSLPSTALPAFPSHESPSGACLPPSFPVQNTLQVLPPDSQNNMTMSQVTAPPSVQNVPVGVNLAMQGLHSNIDPNLQRHSGGTLVHHNMTPNLMIMGATSLPHSNVPNMYPTSHHQERLSLQQQIQEVYCLPPSTENQEKVRSLQERLSLLQQHETNEKCVGGPDCILQNSGYGSKMVESPQVTSTTGRGRGKGVTKPRKPRVKKDKQALPVIQSLDQLPVSEDCVTAGTGIQTNSEIDPDVMEDIDTVNIFGKANDGKMKKPRGPRKTKERKPRVLKEAKIKDNSEKPVKARKKREPKNPNAPRRQRNTKKDTEILADTTTCYEFTENKSTEVSQQKPVTLPINPVTKDVSLLGDSNVTDFDDIPVSKIAIKDLLEEVEAKRDLCKDDEDDSLQKRKNKKRTSLVTNLKRGSARKILGGRRKRRGGIIPDSDGEPDDLVATPPPSPPPEADDSMKRRSARNTQRKKYTDDVLLRLSDEEFPASVPKTEIEHKSEELGSETPDNTRVEAMPKPNYMYVNTTDEDSMIVQHVLACRMGKREIKCEIQTPLTLKESIDSFVSSNTQVNTNDKDKNMSSEFETDKTSFEQSRANVSQSPVKDNNEQKTLEINTSTETDKIPEFKTQIVDIEEYFVKYRNFSYLHCEWKTEEELYKGDKRIFSKIKRFKQKQAQQLNIFELLDEEPFNPDYVEVERILDMSENQDPANSTVVKHYLVKWKSLQYEDSTWELEEDIDVDKIKQFKVFNEVPPKEKWKLKKRPSADNWVQLKESPLYKGGNTLRPYQLEGLNWLLFSWHNNRNCILADEMGLGKTIQSLTFVNSVWEYGIRGPFLIIAPLSTIPNWQREFEAWTEMNVIVYHGSQQSKSMIQEYEFYYKNDKGEPIKDITKFNVLITTFEIIVTDFQELKSFNWRICVIDEAHRLKNRNCKLLEGLRQLHLEHRVLLSGTPLQNNVNELFSLLNFLEPSQFSSSEVFLNEFGQLKTESEVLKLQALLKPMMLRRLKEDVEKTLAPKEETIIEVELTNIQKKYYRAILERNFSFLQKGTASAANIPNLMNTMMELRKCCIHPYLLNGAEDQIQFDYKQTHGEDKEAYYKALIQSSGKMVLVDKLLPKLKAGGHRVLVFSQMVRCLDILEDYLMFRKYPYERIDGRIRGNLRQEAIDRFSKPDSDRFVFLLCTKAGGLGINLTAADTVIIYDSDWNPQNDLQAQARCHRIGQQKMVKIYRLICRNTYEREMFDKASLKLGLDKAILQSMNTVQGKEAGLKQLSKKEIEDLLKKGAYGAVMDEDNAGDKFCEEDIEMILARRTQVIQMESEKGSTFSKASFAATDQRSDIDIRDPDFWNKWAKKAEIEIIEKKEDEDLIVTEPRKRTSIKRYGHDDGNVEMSDMDATPDSDEDEEGLTLRSKKKKDKFGRKGRRYASDDYIPRHEGVPVDEEVVYGSWTRSECFKIERGLLTFGWGRWDEIVDKNQFRKGWTMPVIEDCARIIALYCLRHYKGDEKIRNFIWDLIEPCENGEVTISRNHSGLHNPVPRGRNAKKKNRPKDVPKPTDVLKWEDPNHWSSQEKYDCEAYLESSYKKHLFRHANKVLLRVRMMYYIKHEVIGDYASQIENGTHASALGMRVPRGIDSAPPRIWWDTECDVSLLVGTYIHGYENYLAMRSDPQLCYVDKLGPPDDAECTDIKSEERKIRGGMVGDEDCTDDVSSGAGATSPAASPHPDEDAASSGSHLWPSMQDLNTRLRRLITSYQRNYKREELKLQQRAKMERRERMDQLARDEVSQWRWSRADEEAFRRTVASYGVEFDPTTKSLRWNHFKTLARLDSKSDDALTDYLKAFMAMCKRQCGLSVGEAELPTRADLKAEPIGEERAIATLERIDLLRVLREEVAGHGALDARLGLCERGDAPPWWMPGPHDKALVHGVCKYGLGDTYNKLFCDPKLPFAESARKWYATHKLRSKNESIKSSDEDENSVNETKMSLRRRKRNNPSDNNVQDTDALSELETLAKLGRIEESLSPEFWFTERSLETRLHHIAHAVQNCEWPSAAALTKETNLEAEGHDAKPVQKRQIAIDVETERAKLHALLSSPQAAHAASRETSRSVGGERDDASSDSGSRRSTPAPPPAHQRVAPSPASASSAAPVDLSAPLDLSEAQDFSVGRRTPQNAESSAPAATRSRLDDTLSKLMKRKNVPAPEPLVGKEKKRKKLDEIVLCLSAAKSSNSSAGESSRSRSSSILPDVTVTPAVISTTTSPSAPKPFSVTLTNVTSPQTSKDLSSFLQHSMDQSAKGLKTSTASAPLKSYSHEAKVNKWLAEQASVDTRRRAVTPRLSPDEHVPVVHRVSGKRLIGNKAPQLKNLAQWIAENPMYDIDSKWTEGIKEHVKLPQDIRSQRHSPLQSTSSMGERKKGRPPSLDSSATNILSSGSHLNQNLAGLNPALLASLSSLSAFDPKTLAATLSNLTGFDPKLASNLSSFDPKSSPLLNSFGNIPNLLGNIAGSNIFANLANLGLPGLDMSNLSGANNLIGDNKTKSRKPSESAMSSSCKSASSQFPFMFPNPSMLYPQLGLGGLGAFGMHSGMSSPYDALGLLGNNLAGSSASTTYHSSRSSSKSTTPRTSTVVTSSSLSSSNRLPKTSERQQQGQLPQILLPPDPYILESLSKQSFNYDAFTRSDPKKNRENEGPEATDLSKVDNKKKAPYDALRNQMPPEFAAVQEKLLKGDKKDIDISKMLLEQMASGALSASLVSSTEGKKVKDSDCFDKLSKTSSEYISRRLSSDVSAPNNNAHKRNIDEINEPQDLVMQSMDLPPQKKLKDANMSQDISNVDDNQTDPSNNSGEMDLEDLIAPSTVIKSGAKTSASEIDSNHSKIIDDCTATNLTSTNLDRKDKMQTMSLNPYNEESSEQKSTESSQKIEMTNPLDNGSRDNTADTDASRRGHRKRGRKLSEEITTRDGSRRELRSSSGRQSTDSNNTNH